MQKSRHSIFVSSASDITLALLYIRTELSALLDAFVYGCICTTVLLLSFSYVQAIPFFNTDENERILSTNPKPISILVQLSLLTVNTAAQMLESSPISFLWRTKSKSDLVKPTKDLLNRLHQPPKLQKVGGRDFSRKAHRLTQGRRPRKKWLSYWPK